MEHKINLQKRAVIRETECIGCTKCITACPVDAILGSGKLMHTIITDECTGCELCFAPCPVDCIELVDREALVDSNKIAYFEERLVAHEIRKKREAELADKKKIAADRKAYVMTAAKRSMMRKNK